MNENSYKSKSTIRIISFAVIILMVFSVLPTSMHASVNADSDISIGKGSDLTAKANLGGTQVYFGDYGVDKIKWYVVATDDAMNTATLFSTISLGNKRYNTTTNCAWSGSDICKWLNSEYDGIDTAMYPGDGFLNDAFTVSEAASIAQYGTTEEALAGNEVDISQKIVLPSMEEMGTDYDNNGTWNIDNSNRGLSARWRLRSPGHADDIAAYVDSSGFVGFIISVTVYDTLAVRPALKLNLNSVLFTSDANKVSKTAAVGSSLEKISETPTSVALTLTDSALSLDTDTKSVSGITGSSVEIDYENATTGEGMSVSVMICDEDNDEMLYYGRPVDLSKNDAESSGTAEVEIPRDIDVGGYIIKIFNEQVNSTNLTDYASTPQEVALTVEEDNPVADEYTVTLDVNGGQALPNNKLKVTNGKSYGTLPTPKRTGYTFSGWYTEKTGGKKITSGTTVTLTADQTLFSRWSPNKYTVTFMGNKGKVKKSGKYKSTKLSKSLVYGKKYGTLPKAKRTGYKFKGWYTKKSGGKKITQNTVLKHTKATKVYARWTPNAKIANCKWVHMRKAPGVHKITKKYVKKGTKVSILKTVKVSGKYKWYKIRVGNKVGYIYSKYVKRV